MGCAILLASTTIWYKACALALPIRGEALLRCFIVIRLSTLGAVQHRLLTDPTISDYQGAQPFDRLI
jgi:hypothetical protein